MGDIKLDDRTLAALIASYLLGQAVSDQILKFHPRAFEEMRVNATAAAIAIVRETNLAAEHA